MKFSVIKIILVIAMGVTVIHSFSMDTSPIEKIIENFSKFSKVTLALSVESTLDSKIKQEIREFNAINQELIETIQKHTSLPSLQATFPAIFNAMASFVGDLEKNSSRKKIIQHYMPHYKSMLADLAILQSQVMN